MKKRYLSFLAITMMIATSSQAQIPTNGLVAYYPFSGNANDSSGNGNNGTVNGANLSTDRFGKANSAYSFNGLKSIINTNWVGIQGQNDRTISMWFKIVDSVSSGEMLAYGGGYGGGGGGYGGGGGMGAGAGLAVGLVGNLPSPYLH